MNLRAMQAAASPQASSEPEARPAQAKEPARSMQPAAEPNGADANENIFDAIRELGKLRDEGLLTEEEFSEKKKHLMKRL